jgi:hypothetical protein
MFVGAVRAVDGRPDAPRGWRPFVAFAQIL